jgi:hypothetical protein
MIVDLTQALQLGDVDRSRSAETGKLVSMPVDVVRGAFVNTNAVAWVLLQVVGTQVGPTGGAALTGTTFVQRLNTFGGLAPSTGCDVPTDLGHKAFMPYTADYFFFTKN